ncbi:MAG: Ig-like domain-containing protein [Lachnoclostridium sp.]|jgi:hypothetical protein|nr:Ig-like domain-containing protein [Lachnoclostridium sp.]
MKRIIRSVLFLVALFSFTVLSLGLKSNSAALPIRINLRSVDLAKNQNFTLRVYNVKKRHRLSFNTKQDNIIRLPDTSPRSRKIQIQALDIGTATVKVTVRHKRKPISVLYCTINVTPPAFSVKFKTQYYEMNARDFFDLNPIIKPVNSSSFPIYSSSDKNVVTVNAKGRVRAIDGGEATITATLPNGQTDTCRILVWDSLPWADVYD